MGSCRNPSGGMSQGRDRARGETDAVRGEVVGRLGPAQPWKHGDIETYETSGRNPSVQYQPTGGRSTESNGPARAAIRKISEEQ